jgi:hypothetical protein
MREQAASILLVDHAPANLIALGDGSGGEMERDGEWGFGLPRASGRERGGGLGRGRERNLWVTEMRLSGSKARLSASKTRLSGSEVDLSVREIDLCGH